MNRSYPKFRRAMSTSSFDVSSSVWFLQAIADGFVYDSTHAFVDDLDTDFLLGDPTIDIAVASYLEVPASPGAPSGANDLLLEDVTLEGVEDPEVIRGLVVAQWSGVASSSHVCGVIDQSAAFVSIAVGPAGEDVTVTWPLGFTVRI